MAIGLAERCYEAAHGDGIRALAMAVRITRYQLVAAGMLIPEPDEPLPVHVRQAAHAFKVVREHVCGPARMI